MTNPSPGPQPWTGLPDPADLSADLDAEAHPRTAADWTPEAIRAWCLPRGRDPAWFLDPAPRSNPDPDPVQRMAARAHQRPVEPSAAPDPAHPTDQPPESPQ
jgi:hypothetical protein